MIFSIYSFSASNSGFLDSLDYIWKYAKCILKSGKPNTVQCMWSWPPAPPTSPGWWTSWNSLWPQWLKINSCVARLRQMLEDSKEEGIGKMTTKLWLCGWVLYSSVFCWRWYQGCLSCLSGYQKFTERWWQRRWCPLVWSTAYSSWLPRNIYLVFAAALLSNNSFWPNCSFLCKLLCSWNLAVKTSCSSRASTSCPLLAPAWSRGRHWRAERSRVNPSPLWTTTPRCSPACVPECLSKSLKEARRSSWPCRRVWFFPFTYPLVWFKQSLIFPSSAF